MAEVVLEAERLRKVFRLRGRSQGPDEIVAVDDLSFSLAEGESLAIVGESGSGKTTLARMLVGLERPTAGRISLAGRDRSSPARTTSERRRRGRETQMVFQDPYSSLDPRQTPASSIEEVLQLHFRSDRASRAARVAELPEQVGLDGRQMNALPRGLSGGQRQRVAIARALAAEPARPAAGRSRRLPRRLDPGADPEPAGRHPRREWDQLRGNQPRPRCRPPDH